MIASLTTIAQLPGLGQEGPDDLNSLLDIFYVLFALGFLVAVGGHMAGSRTVVAIGIAMVFGGTAAFMLAVGARG